MSGEIQAIQQGPLTIEEMKSQVNLIQKVMREVMHEGEHFGTIPGSPKPCLYKAGAEKLNLLFRLDPEYEITEKYEDTGEGRHYTVVSKCTLYHAPTGNRLGSGFGSCSTREKKYAYRDAQRKCPTCQKEAIIKGKVEYGGGWLCFAKKGGCGAKFNDEDTSITEQVTGQIPNPDLPDLYNTILKMSNKRSLIAADLNVTAASDIFTQDLEEMPAEVVGKTQGKTSTGTKPATKTEPIEAEIVMEGMEDWVEALKAATSKGELDEIMTDAVSQNMDEAGLNWLRPHFERALAKLEKKPAPAGTPDEAKYRAMLDAAKDGESVLNVWKTIPQPARTNSLKAYYTSKLDEHKKAVQA